MGWTDAGKLRDPVYRGVRDDLSTADVASEKACMMGRPQRSRRGAPMDLNDIAGKASELRERAPGDRSRARATRRASSARSTSATTSRSTWPSTSSRTGARSARVAKPSPARVPRPSVPPPTEGAPPIAALRLRPVTTMLTWQAHDGHGFEGARVLFGAGKAFRALGPDRPRRADGDCTASYRLVVSEDGDARAGRRSPAPPPSASGTSRSTAPRTATGCSTPAPAAAPRTRLRGAVDVDLAGSAMFNALPVRRLGLHRRRASTRCPWCTCRCPTLEVAVVSRPTAPSPSTSRRRRSSSVRASPPSCRRRRRRGHRLPGHRQPARPPPRRDLVRHTADLAVAELAEVRALLHAAFDGDIDDTDVAHAFLTHPGPPPSGLPSPGGGMHVLVRADGVLAAHGAVVARRLLHGQRSLRTARSRAHGTHDVGRWRAIGPRAGCGQAQPVTPARAADVAQPAGCPAAEPHPHQRLAAAAQRCGPCPRARSPRGRRWRRARRAWRPAARARRRRRRAGRRGCPRTSRAPARAACPPPGCRRRRSPRPATARACPPSAPTAASTAANRCGRCEMRATARSCSSAAAGTTRAPHAQASSATSRQTSRSSPSSAATTHAASSNSPAPPGRPAGRRRARHRVPADEPRARRVLARPRRPPPP